ncbi:TPA: phage replication protein [Kluyvera ascorbata]|uniref:replication protein P n=1 Tax=Kluyvera ascorbata TaxID=51288 RepID=UPI0029159631|nr:replication protein P [Kluyvera ascorbata]MDU3912052.1 replication protein P [Kluyvera ascorbata]HDG1723119.1 phage replication protein [Kluyvera ascorbata]
MKSIAEQMHNYDREQMQRVAYGLPEQYEPRQQVEQTAQIFNELFNQLRAAFPASMANFRNQAELNEFRRQWLLAFHENGINSIEQVAAGMRVARTQERPFLPSPGQFVAWCKQSGGVLNVTAEDVITEYWSWRNRSFEFSSSEQFPWSQPVMYHICTELRSRSTEKQLTHSELSREASAILEMWEKRVMSGKPIPPVRRALCAPTASMGPTPAQMLLAKYKRIKESGGSQS